MLYVLKGNLETFILVSPVSPLTEASTEKKAMLVAHLWTCDLTTTLYIRLFKNDCSQFFLLTQPQMQNVPQAIGTINV